MKRHQAISILTHHQQDLAAFGLRRLALFGSVARDTAGPASDIDILVEFEGAPTFDRYVELSFYLEDLLHRPIDLITAAFLRDSVEQDALDVPGLSPLPR